MSRPLHFNILIELEAGLQILAHHLVHNGAVVDAQDWSTLAGVFVEKNFPTFLMSVSETVLTPSSFSVSRKSGNVFCCNGSISIRITCSGS